MKDQNHVLCIRVLVNGGSKLREGGG